MAGAHRVTAWLEHRGPSGGVIPRLDARDSPPRPVHTPQPVDPRVEDALFSESTVAITAIVEADGSLSHVIARSPHDRLRTATLAAVRMWRLTPATRAGVPKPIPITFPVQFPVRDNRLFSLSDVEREPVLARSGSAAALNLRGMVKEDLLEDFAGALADFDRAIELAPQEHRFFYTNRARVRLAQFRDFEGAVADMNQAFDLGPGDAADYYIRGLAYYRLRKREEAFADMDRSLTLRPPERAAYYYRGLIHRQRKEVSAAVADFTQARFRAPSQLARQFPHAIPAAREEPQLRTRAGRSGAAIDPRAERPLGHRH